jgi:cytochrome P450
MILKSLRHGLARRKPAPHPLFNSQTLADPYPAYQRFRTADPIHWDEINARWLLFRHADIAAVLRSPSASSNRAPAMQRWVPPGMRQLIDYRSDSMINCDAPRHNRLRLLVNKAFTTRAVEAMAGNIQRLVDGFLDAVAARGRMDLIADLAYPLPVTVIAEMLGVPPEDRDQFKHWSDELVVTISGNPSALRPRDFRRVGRYYAELSAYFAEVVARRRAQPRNDLLTALAQAEEAGDRLNESELYANAALLLVAGHETTTNLIGNGMLALLRHPDQWERLKADPALVPGAVEELLRYDSPVQFTARLLTQDMEIGGKRLQAGQMVQLALGSGNRDPEQYADPERLDVGRQDVKHLAFGLGSHYCLGAPLARLEARIVFETLLRRFPNLHLDGAEPKFRDNFNLRGLEALPVAF